MSEPDVEGANFMARFLAMMRAARAGSEPQERPPNQLTSFDLEGVAEHIKSDKCTSDDWLAMLLLHSLC